MEVISIEISPELAQQLQPYRKELARILALGLSQIQAEVQAARKERLAKPNSGPSPTLWDWCGALTIAVPEADHCVGTTAAGLPITNYAEAVDDLLYD